MEPFRRLAINSAKRLLQPQKQISVKAMNVHKDKPYNTEMYENPYVLQHQRRRDESVPKDFHKQTTGLCGLYVSLEPHKELKGLYTRLIRILEMMPKEYAYRQSTEEIVLLRFGYVNSEPDIAKLEEKIGMGQIEEVIEQAQYELETARILVQHKAWEPLIESAEESQWRWPIGSGP